MGLALLALPVPFLRPVGRLFGQSGAPISRVRDDPASDTFFYNICLLICGSCQEKQAEMRVRQAEAGYGDALNVAPALCSHNTNKGEVNAIINPSHLNKNDFYLVPAIRSGTKAI